MQHQSTHAIYLIKLVDVLRGKGVSADGLLRHIGVTGADLINRDRTIPLGTYLRAIEYATETFPVPDLGFTVGEHTSVLEHGVLGYALLSSPSLGDSLQRYVRYQYLQGPLLTVQFSSGNEMASMTALPRTGRWKLSPGALKYVVQEWLVGWNQWCQFIGKNGPFFEHVRLGYSASGERSHYADHLGCTVSFDNNETTGFFAARWLEQPLEFANGAIAALCAAQCERLLEVIDGRVGLAAEIHRRLANSPGIVASMDEMANGLHVGVRTLRRRLKNEGTTYQDVVREFRVGMAKRYLQETELPANEIALLVGYSDPGNLYRVFLDMTGQTPREFRDTIGRE